MFTEAVRNAIDHLATIRGNESAPIISLSAAVGAIALSRAVDAPDLAGQILEATRAELLDRHGGDLTERPAALIEFDGCCSGSCRGYQFVKGRQDYRPLA